MLKIVILIEFYILLRLKCKNVCLFDKQIDNIILLFYK